MPRTSYLLPMLVSLTLAVWGCAKESTVSTPEKGSKPAHAKAEKAAEKSKAKGESTAESAKAGVTVMEATACRAIQEHAPVEAGATFPANVGRVYVYTKVGMNDG